MPPAGAGAGEAEFSRLALVEDSEGMGVSERTAALSLVEGVGTSEVDEFGERVTLLAESTVREVLDSEVSGVLVPDSPLRSFLSARRLEPGMVGCG